MRKLRILLLPLGWIYGLITWIRNALYDAAVLKSYKIPVKSVCVGNLSVGGTGKTPTVDFLAGYFISQGRNVATLSRGYGRSSRGVIFGNQNSTPALIGDEPLMYKLHHGDQLQVVVAEKRKEGVEQLLEKYPDTDLILLDDAFQHRAVSAGLNILVTQYDHLFTDDFMMPAGNLREWPIGKKRANAIIVSKCPQLPPPNHVTIAKRLGNNSIPVFFSAIRYGELKSFGNAPVPHAKNILLVTGIGNPAPLIRHLEKQARVVHLHYRDHHAFESKDILTIHEKFDTFASRDKIIVTTEKDYMRIKDISEAKELENQWFYQPIITQIDNEEPFKRLLNVYVDKI